MLVTAFALSIAALTTDTTAYVVLNHGRPAGEMTVVTAGDSVVIRYRHIDRNRGTRLETRYRLVKGRAVAGATWQVPLYGPQETQGAPADRFEVVRDSVTWTARDSSRGTAFTPATFYRLRSATGYDLMLLAQHLLRQPNRTSQLLPNGSARLDFVADTTLRTHAGRLHLRLAMISGGFGGANGVWLDDKGALVATQAGWFITVRRGSEDVLPALRTIEIRYRDGKGADVARKVAPPATSAIAIVNGDVFDSERGVVLPKTTVVIRGDRIVAVGPTESTPVPAGATVIDATGKTVMPGMWDMHTHLQPTSQTGRAVQDLATGITTLRDVASDVDVAVSHRDRAATGAIAIPRLILAGFMEGPGAWAGPSEVIVKTEDEARGWVARYDSLGYKQIKLYNLIQQDLVPAIADEAHKRGMRLSGHIPRGLSTQAAVRLGFDEVNHIAFLLSTFFPDSLYLPQMRAYSAVASAVAPNFNVDGPEMTALIDLFKERGTVIDPTVNLWLSARAQGGVPAPNVGIPAPASDSLALRADAAFLRIVKRLYDAGITIVPGTDGSSYNSELENYERAGIPSAQVLRIATIVPARVMRDDKDYGSIAIGKVADVIIVAGKPAEHVSDLRKVERVIRAGRMYEPRALRAAIGGQP